MTGDAQPVTIKFVPAAALTRDEVVDLYDSVGWTAYTRDPDLLMRALAGSHRIVTARAGGRLVGLARSLSDGATILYVQDILVAPAAHRSGIGSAITRTLLESYGDIRQRVLITDGEPGQRRFYESLGFTDTADLDPPARCFVRFS